MGMSFSRDGAAITTVSADRTVRTFSLAVLTDRRITSTHRTLREDPVDVAHGESAADLVILSTGILGCFQACEQLGSTRAYSSAAQGLVKNTTCACTTRMRETRRRWMKPGTCQH